MPADRRSLTAREIDVLRLIAVGRTNREIGMALSIGVGTVKGHLQRIYRKLRVGNRTQAAVEASRTGRLHRKVEIALHRSVDVER